MTASSRFTFKQPHVVFESFADEVVLIHLASGNYYSADKVGKTVIEMLAECRSLAEIASDLAALFDVSRAEIETGLAAFVTALQAEDLIVPAAAPDPGAGIGGQRLAPPADGDRKFTPPQLRRYSDMQDLLLLDPIHEVDDSGWPVAKPDVPQLDE